MSELIEILSAMVSKKPEVEDPLELFLDITDRVVKAVSGMFGAKADEVAVLILTSDRGHLRFVAPRKFVNLGTIPVTKRDSIAVGVLGRKVGEAINNVPLVKHVAFFESVKLRDRPAPIQKMITVPILHGEDAVGVAQVSRKGESPADAGPDFTTADVRKCQGFFQEMARFFVEARPERF